MSDDSRDSAGAGKSTTGQTADQPVSHARDAVAAAAERARAAAGRVEPDAPVGATDAPVGDTDDPVGGTDDPVGELRRVELEAEAYIRRNPLRSVVMAFAAGYLIAMIRRF